MLAYKAFSFHACYFLIFCHLYFISPEAMSLVHFSSYSLQPQIAVGFKQQPVLMCYKYLLKSQNI